MPNLDDLKKRIGSVKSTQKITKAMKMVAAAKLRRAQESAESSRPYADSMRDLIGAISSGYSPTSTESLIGTTLMQEEYLDQSI